MVDISKKSILETFYIRLKVCFTTLAIFFCLLINHSFANNISGYHSFHPELLCLNAIKKVEREKNIPDGLLHSIAMIESGKYTKEFKKTLPWAWTLNVKGRSYYYKTKTEALKKIKSISKNGFKNMDVGCMQINLNWHPEAFKNSYEALNPKKNILYAAEYLTKLKNQYGSWKEAVGKYHSFTHTRSKNYAKKVLRAWRKYKKNKSEYTQLTKTPPRTISANFKNFYGGGLSESTALDLFKLGKSSQETAQSQNVIMKSKNPKVRKITFEYVNGMKFFPLPPRSDLY